MTAPLAFLDIETTSLDEDRREAWEVAVIRREPDGSEVEWSAFVRSVDMSGADLASLRIGRYFERHPEGRLQVDGYWSSGTPPMEDGLSIAIKVGRLTHEAHVVGACPWFDTLTLSRLLRRHNVVPTWHYHLIDVEALAVGALAERGQSLRPPWQSADVYAALGLEEQPEQDRHTALGDARAARAVFDAVMAGRGES